METLSDWLKWIEQNGPSAAATYRLKSKLKRYLAIKRHMHTNDDGDPHFSFTSQITNTMNTYRHFKGVDINENLFIGHEE